MNGYEIPLHRSLTESILLGGAPRSAAILIGTIAAGPQEEWALTGLSMLLQDHELKAALHPYTIEGPHGRLLDADQDDISLADIVCFEMEDLMPTEAPIAPVITHFYRRLMATKVDCRRTRLSRVIVVFRIKSGPSIFASNSTIFSSSFLPPKQS